MMAFMFMAAWTSSVAAFTENKDMTMADKGGGNSADF